MMVDLSGLRLAYRGELDYNTCQSPYFAKQASQLTFLATQLGAVHCLAQHFHC